jgi:cell division protein FtsB
MTPKRLWQFFFVIWLVFLSGGVHALFRVGPPGAWQAVRLHLLLEDRRAESERIRGEIARVQGEVQRLESNRTALEREIRKVLGYAAPDELIFDFSASERQLSAVRALSQGQFRLAARAERVPERGFFDKRPGTRKTLR